MSSSFHTLVLRAFTTGLCILTIMSCATTPKAKSSMLIPHQIKSLDHRLPAVSLTNATLMPGRTDRHQGMAHSYGHAISRDGSTVARWTKKELFLGQIKGDELQLRLGASSEGVLRALLSVTFISNKRLLLRGFGNETRQDQDCLIVVNLDDTNILHAVSSICLDAYSVHSVSSNGTLIAVSADKEGLVILRVSDKGQITVASHLDERHPDHHAGRHGMIDFQGSRLFYALYAGYFLQGSTPWKYVADFISRPKAVFGVYDMTIAEKPQRVGEISRAKNLTSIKSNGIEGPTNWIIRPEWLLVGGDRGSKIFRVSAKGVGEELDSNFKRSFKMVSAINDRIFVGMNEDFNYEIWEVNLKQRRVRQVGAVNNPLSDEHELGADTSTIALPHAMVNFSIWNSGYDLLDVSNPAKPVLRKLQIR